MTTRPVRRLGIIGVGHLASFLVEGLRRVEPQFDILLSPRNEAISRDLASRFNAGIAADNQSLADDCDMVIVSLRPEAAGEVLQQLRFSSTQVVVSVMAGVSCRTLEDLVAPAMSVRAMPVSSAAISQSPTVIYPAHDNVAWLFRNLGSVHAVTSEASFDRLSMIGAYYAWLFALFADSIDWFANDDVGAESARQLVLQSVLGAAGVALNSPTANLSDILDQLATPGGITERGLKVLDDRDALDAWQAALQAAHDHVQQGD